MRKSGLQSGLLCALLAWPAFSLGTNAAAATIGRAEPDLWEPPPPLATIELDDLSKWRDARGEAIDAAAPLSLSAECDTATASQAPGEPVERQDPWQPFNRFLYKVHNAIDRGFLRPVSLGYVKITPSFFRAGIRNVFSNLHEPVVFANDTLQLRPKRAGSSLLRLTVNTTMGIGGLFDVATHLGVNHHDNDFGITMGRLHMSAGPYLFVPLMGPTSVRDLVGTGVDTVFDPLVWYHSDGATAAEIGGGILNGLDQRASVDSDLETMQATSLDPYTTIRSVYFQQRETAIHGGSVQINELPAFDEGPAAPSPANAAADAHPTPAPSPARQPDQPPSPISP